MDNENLIAWYQKILGRYDKQQWEKTVEQGILHSLNGISVKTAKPKNDLIDLDLVRGSSFTKAKPKHGFLTVTRLSTLRFFFLPLYSKWWTKQTSGKIFLVLLLLYVLQLFNLAVYFCNIKETSSVPTSEIIVPLILLAVLIFIHSQIVATSPGPEKIKPNLHKYRKSFRRSRRVRKANNEKTDSTEQINKERRAGGIRWSNNLIRHLPPLAPSQRPQEQQAVNEDLLSPESAGHDDGFESLNGNNSSPSDNGEESKDAKEECSSTRPGLTKPAKCLTTEHHHTPSGFRCNEWVKEIRGVRRRSLSDLPCSSGEIDSDSDRDTNNARKSSLAERRKVQLTPLKAHFESTCDTDEEGECETISSPGTSPSAGGIETAGITTNSEECSYSSEFSESDAQFDIDAQPTAILSGPSDRVSCTIWEGSDMKKAELSVIEISCAITKCVESMGDSLDYLYLGVFFSTILSILPILCRFCGNAINSSSLDKMQLTLAETFLIVVDTFHGSFEEIIDILLGTDFWERTLLLTAAFQRFVLGFFLFVLLAVAERTFKQRFLYAKLFGHLTSSRRARKYKLPHFRLNKVRNIKTWLSVRSYLKKRGPQRSVDVIVSAAFIVVLLLLSFLCLEFLKESFTLNSQYSLEILLWIVGLGCMIMRFMMLGIKINNKYRNQSVLIMEQINLYLQIEQKPHKKEELMVANSVLKLAADLLKELESQFKIVGLSANPFFYNIIKVVILSALSGVLSEILGFKLKLHKIKIK